MHRIWANDLPDNCIDDMEALHLAIILICNFLQFVAHFKVWKGCQEARGVAETSQSGESGQVGQGGQMGVKNLRWRNPNRRVATQS